MGNRVKTLSNRIKIKTNEIENFVFKIIEKPVEKSLEKFGEACDVVENFYVSIKHEILKKVGYKIVEVFAGSGMGGLIVSINYEKGDKKKSTYIELRQPEDCLPKDALEFYKNKK